MSRGAEVSSGNMNWCAVPKPDRHPTVVVQFKSRSGKSESKTEWVDPGSASTVRTTRWWSHGKQPDRQEAWDMVWGRRFSKCREDLMKKGREDVEEDEEGGGAGKEEMFSGLGWVTRWGHVQEWKGWHQVRGVGRLRGREHGHGGHLLQGWHPCALESTGALFSILSSKPWNLREKRTWVSPKTRLSVWREVRPVSQRDLTDSAGSWLNGSPLLPDLRRCFTSGLTMWLYKAVHVWFDGSLKICVLCSHFLNMKGPWMNPTEARKQWNPNTGSWARGTKGPRSVQRKGMS